MTSRSMSAAGVGVDLATGALVGTLRNGWSLPHESMASS